MPYSQRGVDRTLEDIAKRIGVAKFRDGDKVELSVFMAAGVGVCRHQALACAVTLERFKDEGHIRGSISIDRNIRRDPKMENSDGHAWVRYTSHGGNIMILDVAQNYFGLLKDSSRDAQWNYMRPEEQQRVIAPELGHFGMDLIQNEPPLVFQA